MVLAADDELAYGRVMGVISECGDAFIMDAYLGTEEMMNIIKHSNASRFLVGDKLPKNRLTELAVLIELTPVEPGGAPRELRQAAFHDRWVVGDHKVYGLGASINGVGGKSMTTLIEMPDAAARFIRDAAEGLWSDAKVIAETRQGDTEPRTMPMPLRATRSSARLRVGTCTTVATCGTRRSGAPRVARTVPDATRPPSRRGTAASEASTTVALCGLSRALGCEDASDCRRSHRAAPLGVGMWSASSARAIAVGPSPATAAETIRATTAPLTIRSRPSRTPAALRSARASRVRAAITRRCY